ncbi:hypothetical protein ACFFRR_003916 [Megaselia abdita]
MEIVFLLLILSGHVLSSPIKFTEGDIVLTPLQEENLYSPVLGRNGYISVNRRWPQRTLYYKFSPVITTSQKNEILESFQYISNVTCMQFKAATFVNKDYVFITNDNSGCWSHVGYISGVQRLNLQSNGCMYHGTIVHETLHSLGFFHQQSASNRDDYVKILFENVSPGTEGNFKKYSSSVISNYGFTYDYGSIMHYGRYYFSKNGLPTITSKTSQGQNIGQREELSPIDIAKINKMYNCY